MAKAVKRIISAAAWEGEAVDFIPVVLRELSHVELLKYAKEAQDFIFKTMAVMELRPKRSHARAVRAENGGVLFFEP